MPGLTARPTVAALLIAFSSSLVLAQEEASDVEVVISIAEQRMAVLREGMWIEKYKVSTSKFGVGDSYGSYKTPVGRHRICDKIGEGLPLGAVIKHRNATGEILPANARGRDPIVTRILWLEGLEARNSNARSRGIYIHGTVEEDKVGNPVSYGCIRMRSRDVMDVFEALPLGTIVTIQQEKLPHYKKWSAPPTMLLVSNENHSKTAVEKIPPPEKKPVPEKPDPDKAEVKVVSAKLAKESAAAQPSRGRASSRASASQSEEQESASVPRVSFGGAAAIAALKGSILFSDLPGHAPKVEGLVSESEATLPEPIGENVAATPPMPRVSFRAPVGERVR